MRDWWNALEERSPAAAWALAGAVMATTVQLAFWLLRAGSLQPARVAIPASALPKWLLVSAASGAVAGAVFAALLRRLGGRERRGAGPLSAACAGAAGMLTTCAAAALVAGSRYSVTIIVIAALTGAFAGLFYYWIYDRHAGRRRHRALARFRTIRR